MTNPVRAIANDLLFERHEARELILDYVRSDTARELLRKHKITPLLCHHYGLEPSTFGIDEDHLDRNARRHDAARAFVEAHRDWNGIAVKGCSTARLYDNPLVRQVFDLDIVTTKQKAVALFDHLRDAGYDILDEDGQIIGGPETRSAKLHKLMYLHEMPPLRKADGIIVDLNFHVTYRGTPEFRELFSIDAIEQYFAKELAMVRGLHFGFPDPMVDLLYLVVHYAAEIFLWEFEDLRPGVPDIRLAKVLDVAMYLRKTTIPPDAFEAVATAASAERLCGFFFDLLSGLFDLDEARQLAIRFAPGVESFRNSYMTKAGKLVHWAHAPSERIEHLREEQLR